MKLNDLLKVVPLSTINAVDALAEVQECIEATKEIIEDDRKVILQSPRAVFIGRVHTRLAEERLLLRSLRRRERRCIELMNRV